MVLACNLLASRPEAAVGGQREGKRRGEDRQDCRQPVLELLAADAGAGAVHGRAVLFGAAEPKEKNKANEKTNEGNKSADMANPNDQALYQKNVTCFQHPWKDLPKLRARRRSERGLGNQRAPRPFKVSELTSKNARALHHKKIYSIECYANLKEKRKILY